MLFVFCCLNICSDVILTSSYIARWYLRRDHFRRLGSRFSGAFLFSDEEECKNGKRQFADN